jgi:hypothetical protein
MCASLPGGSLPSDILLALRAVALLDKVSTITGAELAPLALRAAGEIEALRKRVEELTLLAGAVTPGPSFAEITKDLSRRSADGT